MKRIVSLLVLIVLTIIAALAFAADPVAVAPVAPVATVGFLDWFKQNSTVVIGFALALSEVLSMIPAFKGNGILDTIIKGLHALSEKPAA